MRQWIVMLCGLLMVAQGIASATSLLPLPERASPGHPAPMMMHCHGSPQGHSGAKAHCCDSPCTDMANCLGQAAPAGLVSLNLDFAPPPAPPAPLTGGFVPPDPDARLRPPTPRQI